MNIYYYWFFFIYNLYFKLSRDKDFYVFAVGMFNVFIISLLIAFSKYISVLFNTIHFIFSYGVEFIIGVAVFSYTFHYILFLYKRKHYDLFRKYLEVQTTKKDILCFILSIGSLFLLFYEMFSK